MELNPKLIRSYTIIDNDPAGLVQFYGIGDKHKMIRQNDGTTKIITLLEQGGQYTLGAPIPYQDAIEILFKNNHKSHIRMASDLKIYFSLGV